MDSNKTILFLMAISGKSRKMKKKLGAWVGYCNFHIFINKNIKRQVNIVRFTTRRRIWLFNYRQES